MSRNDISSPCDSCSRLLEGPALGPAQAHTPTVLGRQFIMDGVLGPTSDLEYIARSLRGTTIQVSPPFIISDQELTLLVTAIEQAITERENR